MQGKGIRCLGSLCPGDRVGIMFSEQLLRPSGYSPSPLNLSCAWELDESRVSTARRQTWKGRLLLSPGGLCFKSNCFFAAPSR